MIDDDTSRRLVKVLELHRQELVLAGADQGLLAAYEAAIVMLQRQSAKGAPAAKMGARKSNSRNYAVPPESEIAALSLEKIEKIAGADEVPRKHLEAIAIHRFHVPRGSMRSYPSIRSLKEKILTCVRNERAHETIKLVARKSGGQG